VLSVASYLGEEPIISTGLILEQTTSLPPTCKFCCFVQDEYAKNSGTLVTDSSVISDNFMYWLGTLLSRTYSLIWIIHTPAFSTPSISASPHWEGRSW